MVKLTEHLVTNTNWNSELADERPVLMLGRPTDRLREAIEEADAFVQSLERRYGVALLNALDWADTTLSEEDMNDQPIYDLVR